ncbi:hypothetical protein [Bergeriella denitrificans]|uniref:Uncharacterized protein n=1 Tax=Bergeriella denitrificans TaxID=494 RepID=A0A378UH67_BERDE|nr:hypothetical protein [Bergeriella denitrificans]STZ75822.1 Uncharacterised protein [Bergeriella denitrificans]
MKFLILDKVNENLPHLFYQMERENVRNLLNSHFQEFYKSEFSTNTTDNFYSLNLHCYYDNNNRLEEMEIFCPNECILFSNMIEFNLLGKNQDDVIKTLYEKNTNIVEQDDIGINIPNLGISLIIGNDGKTECCYIDLSEFTKKIQIANPVP